MRGVVKKWGNSAAVRIPGGILESAHLKINMPVDIREEAGRIVIEPVSAKAFDAATLIAAITSKNVHAEVDVATPAELAEVRAKAAALIAG